jgi:hypothetical protein
LPATVDTTNAVVTRRSSPGRAEAAIPQLVMAMF